jgi:hypothetical protein
MNPVKRCFVFASVFFLAVSLSGQSPQNVPSGETVPPAAVEIPPPGPETAPPAIKAPEPRMPAVPAPAAGAHRGAVTAILPGAGSAQVYSAGADGFLGVWDYNEGKAMERFQISTQNISQMAFRPSAAGGEEPLTADLAIAENGSNRYRISLWDIHARTKYFSVNLKDPVSFLSWSASGSFLIAATSGSAGLVFINPGNGDFLDTTPKISDRIIFAGTGKSEKSMITYSPAGFLSYWDFDTSEEIRRYPVSRNLSSVLLFGARCFFAGIGSDGLSVYDAVSGTLIARDKSVNRGKLASADPESADFFVMQPAALVQYYLTAQGQLEALKKTSLPQAAGSVNSFFPLKDGRTILGGASGVLSMLDSGSEFKAFLTENQTQLTEAAVSGSVIAFLAEDRNDKIMGIIPQDYRELRNGQALSLTANTEPYSRITPVNPPGASGSGRFILWQPDVFRKFPAMWTGAYSGRAFTFSRTAMFVKLPLRANLRSVSVYRNQALFLTARGALMAVPLEADANGQFPDGTPLFDYQAAGTADAAYLNDRTIILGRNTPNGPPFFTMSPENGTVTPLPDTAETGFGAGVRLYSGTGRLYGVITSRTQDGFFTRVIGIGGNDPVQSVITEYAGEDQNLSVAEFPGGASPAAVAANPGGESAAVFPEGVSFERDAGFPLRVLGGASLFITLDTEGNIAWINPASGNIQARFTLYHDRWFLAERNGTVREGGIIR